MFILVLLKFKLFGYHWVSLSINGIHLLQKVFIVVHCSIIRVQFGFIWVSLEFSELFGYMYLPLGLIVVLMVSITYIMSPLGLSGASLGYIWVPLVKRRIDKYLQKNQNKNQNKKLQHSSFYAYQQS